jgi:hypothetical protein
VIARFAAAEPAALGLQFLSGRAIDRTVDATPDPEGGIGGVDDGVDRKRRDVGNHELEPHARDRRGRQ